MFKAYLSLVVLANLVKDVPNKKDRTIKNMYGLLKVLVNLPLVIFCQNKLTQIEMFKYHFIIFWHCFT
jgi:hypothetical protein